jgi:hypothetical protein
MALQQRKFYSCKATNSDRAGDGNFNESLERNQPCKEH